MDERCAPATTPRAADQAGVARFVVLLERLEALERRAAALYRRFAARCRDAKLAKLWTALADDEDAHARSLGATRSELGRREGERFDVEACGPALVEVAHRLRRGERLPADDTLDRQLAAALALALAETAALRRLNQAAGRRVRGLSFDGRSFGRLADLALDRSGDASVRLAAAVLLTRRGLAGGSPRRPPVARSRAA